MRQESNRTTQKNSNNNMHCEFDIFKESHISLNKVSNFTYANNGNIANSGENDINNNKNRADKSISGIRKYNKMNQHNNSNNNK